MVSGPRGDGKTTSMDKLLDWYVYKMHWKFVWLMRTDDEVKAKKNDMFVETHPDWRVIGRDIIDTKTEIRVDKKGNEYKKVISAEPIGKIIPINLSSKYRSGNSFKDYNLVVWDEFQDENGKYVAKEAEKVFSLLETILRTKKIGEAEVWLISNEVSKWCPLYEYVGIGEHPVPGTMKYFPKLKVCYYRPETSEELREAKKESIVGQFTSKSEYADYAYNHKWKNDDDRFIELAPKGIKKAMFNIILLGTSLGVWRINNRLLISAELTTGKKTYPMTPRDAVDNGLSFQGNDWFKTLVTGSAAKDNIVFTNGTVKDLIFTFIGK
jgi:hypothetical protein